MNGSMNFKVFLERLRAAPDDTKWIWTIAATSVFMAVIVAVWLTFFNNLSVVSEPQVAVVSAGDGGFSLWQSIKSSFGMVYESVSGGIGSFTDKLSQPKSYILKEPE